MSTAPTRYDVPKGTRIVTIFADGSWLEESVGGTLKHVSIESWKTAPDLRAQIEALVQQMRQRVSVLSADGIYSVAEELDQWSERLSALLPAPGKENTR